MSDERCAHFLRWALPRLGLRPRGFSNVKGQVCKRIGRRVAELGLSGLEAYRARLEADPAEWGVLDSLCGVTISRFYRDRGVWDALRDEVLPELAQATLEAGQQVLRCWSIGCASGEEPYTLSLTWSLAVAPRFPTVRLSILAMDFDRQVLDRAHAGVYPEATLRELPEGWRERAFSPSGEGWRLNEPFRAGVEFLEADVRKATPDEPFRLVLCRNMVFTYFGEALQRELLARIRSRLLPGGVLVLGRHEQLVDREGFSELRPGSGIFLHCPSA